MEVMLEISVKCVLTFNIFIISSFKCWCPDLIGQRLGPLAVINLHQILKTEMHLPMKSADQRPVWSLIMEVILVISLKCVLTSNIFNISSFKCWCPDLIGQRLGPLVARDPHQPSCMVKLWVNEEC